METILVCLVGWVAINILIVGAFTVVWLVLQLNKSRKRLRQKVKHRSHKL